MTARQSQLTVLFLNVADLALLLSALALTVLIINAPSSNMTVSQFSVEFLATRVRLDNAILCGILLFVWHLSFKAEGLYFSYRLSRRKELLRHVGRASGWASLALFVTANLGGWETVNVYFAAFFGLSVFGLIGMFRCGAYFLSRRLRRRGINTKSVLIIGSGARSERLIKKLSENHELGYRLIGYLDNLPLYKRQQVGGLPWLGTLEDLPKIINSRVVDEVAIALPIKSYYAQIGTAISQLEEQGVAVHLLSDFFPLRLGQIQPQEFQGLPLISLHSTPPFSWRNELKRMVDFLGAAFLLTLFSPLLILIAIIIKLDSKGSILFVQERMGYNKRRFQMYKFRTMQTDAEARLAEIEHMNEKNGAIFKIRNDPRITRIGKYLRKFSLDELPQLFNVLLGDMSLVGPRPLSIRDAERVEASWQKRRFSVKPGLTCLWQVSGRSNLSFEEWMELDLKYIDNWSLNLDWWILLRTIPAVFMARGAF